MNVNREIMEAIIYWLGFPVYVIGAAACVVEFLVLDRNKAESYKYLLSDFLIIFFEFGVKIIFGLVIFSENIFSGFSIFIFDPSPLTFIVVIILYDLFFYGEHYLMHFSNFFWSLHYVHHSSERFGLSVGFRLSWIRPLRRVLFFAPMVLIGFDPRVVVLAMSIINLWAFIVHSGTKLKFPAQLGFLMSPYLHSIHHERRLIPVNLGGMFTIWDVLFKTIQLTTVENPEYGIAEYKFTLNPIKNQFLALYNHYSKKSWL